jgi:chromosome segregation ATPase
MQIGCNVKAFLIKTRTDFAQVYKDFCAELKIKNISEFEGGTLREQRERKHELNTLSSLVSNFKQKILCNERDHEKIRNQLSGHKSDLKDLQKDIKESEEKVPHSTKSKNCSLCSREKYHAWCFRIHRISS